jgi:glyoxylase-like metal-dependent hydrolase (beta-lactamase superfamily II)
MMFVRSTASAACISRRAAITGSVVAGIGAAIAPPAFAQSAVSSKRFQVGDFEVVVLSDGHMLQTTQMFGTEQTEAERLSAFKNAGVVDGRVKASVNVTLVKRGADVMLIDVGAGPNFTDSTGKLTESLAAAGIDPKSITTVVLTHGHPDHLWGAVDEFDDSARFPNARHVLSEAEWALWMTGDATAKLPADRQNFIPGAKRNLGQLKDRIATVKPGAALAPGVTIIDTAGHTQGHISIGLSSGRASAIILGDALLHPHVSFAFPEWKLAADHEPDKAVAMRRALLDRLAKDQTPIIGYHLPFPGFGTVERRGPAYGFVASG